MYILSSKNLRSFYLTQNIRNLYSNIMKRRMNEHDYLHNMFLSTPKNEPEGCSFATENLKYSNKD